MSQSLASVKSQGVITIIGFVAGETQEQPGFLEVLQHGCIVRGILVGNRIQLEEMCQAIDATGIKPVVDEKVFGLDDLKDAYQYMVSNGDISSSSRLETLTCRIVGPEAFRQIDSKD